jgi:hypothetical protein
MRLLEKYLSHGAPERVDIPVTARYLQIVQLKTTDAARVGLRMRHIPSLWGDDPYDGNPVYMDFAIGDRIPLPFGDHADGPHFNEVEALINYGTGTNAAADNAETRVVFAFAERPDGSDLWLPHQRWADVQQHWVLPAIAGASMPLNRPANYADKDWALIPCKGFRSGCIDLTSLEAANAGGVCVSIRAMGPLNNCGLHVVPLFILNSGDDGSTPIYPHRSVPFHVPDGAYDRLLIRAWRFDDAVATPAQVSRVRLFGDASPHDGIATDSAQWDMGVAGTTNFATCISQGTLKDMYLKRAEMRCTNAAGGATTIDFQMYVYLNAGMTGQEDNHVASINAASGALAAGAAASVGLATDTPAHCMVVKLIPGAAAACTGRVITSWSQS